MPEALVTATSALWVLVAAPAAGAATRPTTGWWTTSGVPVPAVATVAAADVPEGGLLLQGGPDGPSAYGAVRFDLPEGGDPVLLRLTTAEGSGTRPGSGVVACPLTEPFEPAAGGPMSSAPAYDCTTSVAAAAAEGGAAFELELEVLAVGGALELALLPAGPTDRIVLDGPRPEDLRVRSALPAGAQPDDVGADPAGRGPAPSGPVLSPPPSPTTGGGTFEVPPTPAPSAAGERPSASTATARPTSGGPATAAASAAAAADEPSPLLRLLAVVVVAAMVVSWTVAGRAAGGPRPGAASAPTGGQPGRTGWTSGSGRSPS